MVMAMSAMRERGAADGGAAAVGAELRRACSGFRRGKAGTCGVAALSPTLTDGR